MSKLSIFLYIQYGSTPLHQAAVNGHAECANMLIEGGSDVNFQDDVSDTFLWIISYILDSLFVVHLIGVECRDGLEAGFSLCVHHVVSLIPAESYQVLCDGIHCLLA